MVDYQSDTLNRAFAALSDPTRRSILVQLAKKECTVSELAEPFQLTLAAISKHLIVLEQASLVVKKREGRTFRCQLNAEPFREISELLNYFEGFWNERLDALENLLTEPTKRKRGKNAHKSNRKNSTKARRKTRH